MLNPEREIESKLLFELLCFRLLPDEFFIEEENGVANPFELTNAGVLKSICWILQSLSANAILLPHCGLIFASNMYI